MTKEQAELLQLTFLILSSLIDNKLEDAKYHAENFVHLIDALPPEKLNK